MLSGLTRMRWNAPWVITTVSQSFAAARAVLDASLTREKLDAELAYLSHPERMGFELPYGIGWLLTLQRELAEWDDDDARRWGACLQPLAELGAERRLDGACEGIHAATGRSGSLHHQAHGLLGVILCKHLGTDGDRGRRMGQVGAALERATELAARHHLLAGVAALLEVHATHRFVVQHLRHEGLDHRGGQRGGAGG